MICACKTTFCVADFVLPKPKVEGLEVAPAYLFFKTFTDNACIVIGPDLPRMVPH